MLKPRTVLLGALLFVAQPSIAAHSQHLSVKSLKSSGMETRGTEQAPLFVKVTPTEKSNAELAKGEVKEQRAFEVEKRLADLTSDLARYTLYLAIGTGILALLTAGLLSLGFMQIQDAKRSIAAAETAANAARDQVQLGRDEFIATHRPKITLQRIDVFNKKSGLQIIIANAGETAARITGWYARIYYRTDQAAFWPDGEGEPELITTDFWLQPGESKTLNAGIISDDTGRAEFVARQADMFAIGVINYCGGDKIARNTGFCRKWFRGDGTWRIQRHSEYEYFY